MINTAAEFLVDAADGPLSIRASFNLGGLHSETQAESSAIKSGLTGGYNLNLSGVRITNVIVHVDKVIFDIPGRDLNGNGIWTDYDIEILVIIMGHP